ncbi:putative protein-like [Capsicum annuum]|nr:putative protein-like [Capsicum annuum]
MSIHESDAIDAEVADWLHSIVDIPASPVGRKPTEDSTHSIHFGIPHTLAEITRKEDYNKFYEPRVVSIGPINHGKPHVKHMENFKRKAVRELAERAKVDDVSIEQVYASVEEHLRGTRSYYSTLFERISDLTELKKAGIPCSCATDPSIQIHFKSSILSGKLFLPKLTIDEWGVTLLVNLVAYEFSCNLLYKSSGISSYLSFMSMLINGEEDVKELRAKGILQVIFNAGDEELVQFLRNITALPESNPQALRHVKRQISTFFKSKSLPLIVAFSEVKQRYFSGPWSFLMFLAVIFTVSMTVIQTVLTGIQTYK